MIDKEQLFNTWAAPSSPWSAWAKPVLFAGMNERLLGDGPTATNKADEALRVEADEVPAASPQDPMAVVVDLPGAASIQMGVALAKLGYRPVPLFNGCDGPNAVIDLNGMIVWLIRAADDVARANLPESAPPAFLLDSRRLTEKSAATPGKFDNRWMTFPQDFPSGNLLLSKGIRKALVIQPHEGPPQKDLLHVLLRWREDGLEVLGLPYMHEGAAATIGAMELPRPSRFRAASYRILAMVGLRRNWAGGFGSVVPMPSSGGGGGFA